MIKRNKIAEPNSGLMVIVIEGARCNIGYDVLSEFFRKLKFDYSTSQIRVYRVLNHAYCVPADIKNFWKIFLDLLLNDLSQKSKRYKGFVIDIANAEEFLKNRKHDFNNFDKTIQQIGKQLKFPFHVRLLYRVDPGDSVKLKHHLSYMTTYWDADDVPVKITPDGKGDVTMMAYDEKTPRIFPYTNQNPRPLLLPFNATRISKEEFENWAAAIQAKKLIAAMQKKENQTPQDQQRIKRLNQVITNYEKRRKKNYYDQFTL